YMKLVSEFRRQNKVWNPGGVHVSRRRRWAAAGLAHRGGGNIEAFVTARPLEKRSAVAIEDDAGKTVTGFGIGSEVEAFVVGSVGVGCAVGVNVHTRVEENRVAGLLDRNSSQPEGQAYRLKGGARSPLGVDPGRQAAERKRDGAEFADPGQPQHDGSLLGAVAC